MRNRSKHLFARASKPQFEVFEPRLQFSAGGEIPPAELAASGTAIIVPFVAAESVTETSLSVVTKPKSVLPEEGNLIGRARTNSSGLARIAFRIAWEGTQPIYASLAGATRLAASRTTTDATGLKAFHIEFVSARAEPQADRRTTLVRFIFRAVDNNGFPISDAKIFVPSSTYSSFRNLSGSTSDDGTVNLVAGVADPSIFGKRMTLTIQATLVGANQSGPKRFTVRVV